MVCILTDFQWYVYLHTYSYLHTLRHTIVQIIFRFLWDHRAHCGIFENGVLLMYTLEGVSSVANFITAYEVSPFSVP